MGQGLRAMGVVQFTVSSGGKTREHDLSAVLEFTVTVTKLITSFKFSIPFSLRQTVLDKHKLFASERFFF